MLVFVHIEKTAGTTLKFIFRNTFGKGHCDSLKNKKKVFTREDLEYARKVFGTIRCISGHNLVEPTRNLDGEGLRFITILREPLTRMASYYQDDCLRGNNEKPFEEWAADEFRHNMQVRRIAGEENLEKAKRLLAEEYTFVGLTERFGESLKLLALSVPEKLNLKYKKKLITRDNTIKQELLQSQTTRKILAETNELDAALYEYVQTELFPERIRKVQDQLQHVILPEEHYRNNLTWNYQVSVGFNKFVYRQLLKRRSNPDW